MQKLTIFDDSEKVATITLAENGSIFIFARSSREWSEMKRLSTYVKSNDKKYLEKIAKFAQDYNYNTELSDI